MTHRSVRSLSRGLGLIRELSMAGPSSVQQLAKRTGRPKSYYAKQAIAEFLDEQEDYLVAVSRLEDEMPSIPLSKVVKRLCLDR
jgi:RHH-type rel operon transcriptional repressor/antitoxin RelB